MRIETRWTSKPSLIVLTLIILAFLTQIQPCNATESQNTTLTETTSYHFDPGFYNVIKYAENSETDFWIMQETKTPYINITYTAPDKGLLQITLKTTEGNTPYIELSTGWDTDGLTYTNPMLLNETSYMLLTPPMRFSDSNTSTITGGAIYLMELYRWQNTSGVINYTFTTSKNITFELIIHPTNPTQGNPIDFFTLSNAELKEITWSLSGENINWKNQTQTLEINTLEHGNYTITVEGKDAFNNTHTDQSRFTVSPPTLDPQSYDLNFFSYTCPQTALIGEQVTISATIDYSIPFSSQIKCLLFDPQENIVCKELVYNVSRSGSQQFNHQFIAEKEGVKPLILRLYYNIGAGWIEVSESETNLSLEINKADTASIPGFTPIPTIIGILTIAYLLIQKNNGIR